MDNKLSTIFQIMLAAAFIVTVVAPPLTYLANQSSRS
jgi:hypothetical protein